MTGTEKEYLETLKAELAGCVSREDLDEILADYAEHFSIGRAEGRSEEDLFCSLGSPKDAAREIRATYLVNRAEQARSAENIWHAFHATLGLGAFRFIFVLVPFVLLLVLLAILLVAGIAMILAGPVLLLVSVMQLIGIAITVPWWTSPVQGILLTLGLTVAGVILVIADLALMKFSYRGAIRYLRWNIRGSRAEWWDGDLPEGAVSGNAKILRDGATGLDLQLRLGAGEISLDAGTDEAVLLEMTGSDGRCPALRSFSETWSGTLKKVRIRAKHTFASCGWDGGQAHAWDLRVNRSVPAALDILNKAGKTRLALGTLDLSSLRVRNGAGETTVDLAGYRGRGFNAEIRNGIGNLSVRLPRQINLRVRLHRGVGEANVRGFVVNGDTYVLEGGGPGAPEIRCEIRQGVGSLTLEAV